MSHMTTRRVEWELNTTRFASPFSAGRPPVYAPPLRRFAPPPSVVIGLRAAAESVCHARRAAAAALLDAEHCLRMDLVVKRDGGAGLVASAKQALGSMYTAAQVMRGVCRFLSMGVGLLLWPHYSRGALPTLRAGVCAQKGTRMRCLDDFLFLFRFERADISNR